MSRHRKIRALDYEDYDDFADDNYYDDDYYDDAEEPAGEATNSANKHANSSQAKPQNVPTNSSKAKNKPTATTSRAQTSKQQPPAASAKSTMGATPASQKLAKPAKTINQVKQINAQTCLDQRSSASVGKSQSRLKQLKIGSEPTPKQLEMVKRLAAKAAQEHQEVVKGCKPRINLIVCGHVDAGKSTLVGHLLFKLGQVTGKQMHRFEVDSQRTGKASFKFAWALDETEEERQRGVTIDLAVTQFETQQRDIVLLDAPGHVDFIPAVISGAAQADAALLVVDATRGEFETGFNSGGQTREHTFLVRSLGVKSLIVVVNKMDNVDWGQLRFDEIVSELKPFLKQAGFKLTDDVQFVAVSGLKGDNLLESRIGKILKESSHPQLIRQGASNEWLSMPSLIDAIDRIKPPDRPVDKPSRISITDVYKGMSGGVSLGAKVLSGKLEDKQKLLLLPPNETCDIKHVEVQRHETPQKGGTTRANSSGRAFAGDIVSVTITGVELNMIHRGCVLADPNLPCQVTNRFEARIIMIQGTNSILLKGSAVEVHINGIYECAEVRKLISLLNKTTGELIQRRPRCLVKDASALIQLKLERVVCCELYEDNKDLGRFMLRQCGKTIAAGLIIKIKSPKVCKRGSKMKAK